MQAKPLIFQHVKVLWTLHVMVWIALTALASQASAQLQKPSLPDPIKFINKRDLVMRASRAVLEDLGYRIELEDQKNGRLVTRPYEFISGALTSSEIDKVATKTDSITGSWLRATYVVEATFEMVTATETLVTVRTQMQGLNRESDGTEKWVPLQSLGSVEKRVLGKISMKLLGTQPQFKDNKGFWDKKPAPPTPIKKEPAV